MIDSFKNEYAFLSNFYVLEVPITLDGLTFISVEAAYQASKTLDLSLRKSFQNLESGKSKKLGRKLELREDWENVKIPIMLNLVRQKFQNNPKLAQLLLETGEQELLEGNWWGDQFWGVDSKTHIGENHLGKILMQIRAELKE